MTKFPRNCVSEKCKGNNEDAQKVQKICNEVEELVESTYLGGWESAGEG